MAIVYDGIVTELDGLSVGDTFELGAVVPPNSEAASVFLSAEIFGSAYSMDPSFSGGFSLDIAGGTPSLCEWDWVAATGEPYLRFSPIAGGSSGFFPSYPGPLDYDGPSFVAVYSVLWGFAHGTIPADALLTVTRQPPGDGTFDTGSVRVILRQWRGGRYTTAVGAGPVDPSSVIPLTNDDASSGHYNSGVDTALPVPADSDYVLITGLGVEEAIYHLFDPFEGPTLFDTGPDPGDFTDGRVWEYNDLYPEVYCKGFSGVDAVTPSGTYDADFRPPDPTSGWNWTTGGNFVHFIPWKAGDSIVCSEPPPGPYGIFATVPGGLATSPPTGATAAAGICGICATTTERHVGVT